MSTSPLLLQSSALDVDTTEYSVVIFTVQEYGPIAFTDAIISMIYNCQLCRIKTHLLSLNKKRFVMPNVTFGDWATTRLLFYYQPY